MHALTTTSSPSPSSPSPSSTAEQVRWLLPAVLVLGQLSHSRADGEMPGEPGKPPGKYQEVPGKYQEEALVGALRLAATLAAVSPTVTREVIGGRACRRVLQWALRLPTAMARGTAHDGALDTARTEAERQCARLVSALTGAALVGRDVPTTARTGPRPATRGAPSPNTTRGAPPPSLLDGGWSRWLEDVHQALWATAPASEPVAVNTEPAIGVNTEAAPGSVPRGGGWGGDLRTTDPRHAQMIHAQMTALWALSAHLNAITASLPLPPPSRGSYAPGHSATPSATSSAAATATTRAQCEATALWVTKLRMVLLGAVMSDLPVDVAHLAGVTNLRRVLLGAVMSAADAPPAPADPPPPSLKRAKKGAVTGAGAGAVSGAVSGAVLSAGACTPCPPLALLDALLRARREPSDALDSEVLAATLVAVAAFTRCYDALDAHVERSAVLSAFAAGDDGGAPSRAPMDAPSPPPRLRSALLYAMGILSESSPIWTLADCAQYGASPLDSAVPAPFAPSTAPSAPGTALEGGAARQRLRAAALELLDALSERPAVLFAALPTEERHSLLALLARRLERSATTVRLTPSGRVRAADAHAAIGMLRRLTLSGGDQDGATYAWLMGALLAEVAPITARAVGAPGGAPTTARVCAALLGLALIGAASAPQQRAHLDACKSEVLRVLVGIATRPVPLGAVLSADGGSVHGATSSAQHSAADSVRTCALLALTALVTNDQLRLSPTDGAPLMLAVASAAGHHLELRCAPSRASELPSPAAFNSAYFLLVALLRQRSRLVHRAVPLLIAAMRGLLLTASYSSRAAAAVNPTWPEAGTEVVVTVAGTSTADGAAGESSVVPDTAHGARHGATGASCDAATGAFPLECVRNLRRLYELLAAHKKVLVRHGSYLLADVVGVCRERPLPPAAQRELLPGIHALLGMCTEVEVQAVHAASDPGRQRVLKDLLESYQHSFKYKGKA